jgi:molecular chaperone DnaJ
VTTRKESKEQGTISFQQITTCPVCHGQGTFIDHPCENCNGSGEINQEDKLKVTIPAGVDEGAALRIPGHGLPSSDPSGPPGDF